MIWRFYVGRCPWWEFPDTVWVEIADRGFWVGVPLVP